MEFTGERVIPGQTDPDLMNEHFARYCFAEALVGSKRVLDAGCGVGYGSARLAESASGVFALDLVSAPLANGRRQYQHPRLHFVQGDCRTLPFPDASFDTVVAFEVIEHLEEWRLLLSEARRVLVPDGLFIVSTPNRCYYEATRTEPNPFHVHEFDYPEFLADIEQVFPHRKVFLENHTEAITFTPFEVQGIRARLEETTSKPEEAHFFLAVCSMKPLHGSPAFVYLPSSSNVLRERERHIELLEEELKQKSKWLEETTADLEKVCEEQLTEQKRAQQSISRLEELNRQKTRWAQQLEEEVAALRAERDKCIALIDDAEQRVIERTEWAHRLDRELAAIYASRGYRISRRLRLSPDPPPSAAETLPEPEAESPEN